MDFLVTFICHSPEIIEWRKRFNEKTPSFSPVGRNGRAGEIRTRDLLHPMQARYQATLRPEQIAERKKDAWKKASYFFARGPIIQTRMHRPRFASDYSDVFDNDIPILSTGRRPFGSITDESPVRLWSPEHVAILLLTFVVPLVLGWWTRGDVQGQRARIIAIMFAGVLLLQLVLNLMLVGLETKQRWAEFMPLYLCHFTLFAYVDACITRRRLSDELAYLGG